MRTEEAFTFRCLGSNLMGVLHRARTPSRVGVLVVVGGPQYRVGSHRQFVLLARALAGAGIPTMRFDHRGMGDSDGEAISFQETRRDIEAAVAEFLARCEGLEEIVLWGLCDAATAISFYAHRVPGTVGVVLLNPWVHTAAGRARAQVRHYYGARVLRGEFWRKVLGGQWDIAASAKSFFSDVLATFRGDRGRGTMFGNAQKLDSLADRMLGGLEQFEGRVLLVLSGEDLTAAEFRDIVSRSRRWEALLASPRCTRRDLPEADHTFSGRAWRDQVSEWTRDWVLES